jgi:hypothetical protein
MHRSSCFSEQIVLFHLIVASSSRRGDEQIFRYKKIAI